MLTTLNVTTEPAAEVTTVAIAREYCRIDNASDDELLKVLIVAARVVAEGFLSRALITQTMLWTLRPDSMLHTDHARLRGTLRLPRAPVQSIGSVVITDRLGNVTPIAAASLPIPANTPTIGYIADLALEPALLRIGPDTPLIDGTLLHWARIDNVQISMIAGYGDEPDDVPETIRLAILMTVAFLYENRGDTAAEMPKAAEWLLNRHRLQLLGGQ
jgi:uncharacterized phiE125 gp8 family phage protein